MHLVDLGIDPATFDRPRALTLTQAAKLMKGRKGHIHREVILRWANPRRGYRPFGPDGPQLVLPVVRVEGLRLTMAAWVLAFEAARKELLVPQKEAA